MNWSWLAIPMSIFGFAAIIHGIPPLIKINRYDNCEINKDK